MLGREAQNTPPERGGEVEFLHVADDARGAVVATVQPLPAVDFDGQHGIGPGVVKAPAPRRSEAVLADGYGQPRPGALVRERRRPIRPDELTERFGGHAPLDFAHAGGSVAAFCWLRRQRAWRDCGAMPRTVYFQPAPLDSATMHARAC